MKSKRIFSSVSLSIVLISSVFFCSFQSIQAQSYKKIVELNDSLVQFSQKKTFKHAGDKLMIMESLQDTTQKTQLLTLTLLNPDYSTFKTFSRELPIDKYIMYFHNGVDVLELMDGDKPVYYWRYTTDMEDENGKLHNYTTVLNETGDSLYSFKVSFHGARVFDNGESTKIVGESVVFDTIYYEKYGETWWYTMQVLTSSVYDFKTGVKEFTFPKGTLFSKVAYVDNALRMYTQNDNMVNFLTDYHPMGSEVTCMKSWVFNMDYSIYKELDYPFSTIGINMDNINGADVYQPMYDGHNLFFLHAYYSYVKDNEGGIIGNSTRYVLADKDGALVKLLDNPTQVPYSALWLPSRNETVLTNGNGVIFSSQEVDSIGKYTRYTVKDDGSVVFTDVKEDSVRLMDEQLNVIKSFKALPKEWTLSDFSQRKVAADDLLELVFQNYNEKGVGVKVMNENGQLLVNEPDSAWKMSFMEYTPIFLLEKGHKYANLVDDSLGLWNRVGSLKAQAKQQDDVVPLSMQVFSQINDSITLVDSIGETGIYEGFLPEGTYYIRTVSDSLPSTYYPSALLWEDATPVSFTTDSLPVLTINQPVNPQPLSPTDEGSISGTLTSAIPSLLWAIDPKQARVYVVPKGSSDVITSDTLDNLAFKVNHLPYGTYEVLMDIPGKALLTTNTCILSAGQKQGEVEFTLLNNGVSGTVITGQARPSVEKEFSIMPNPASARIRFDAPFEGCKIELFDMSGRKALSTTIQGGEVRISQLPIGMYMVRVQSKEGVLRSMLIKN